MSQNICTSQELKDFADTSEITIPELSKFIEEKTNKKYLVIKRDCMKVIAKRLFDNTLYIIDISKFIDNGWSKLVKGNQEVFDTYQEFLKDFKD